VQDTPNDPGLRTEWAERRTDWAEDRTVLANERTFAGWLRTALGSVGVALGLHALFRTFEPDWLVKVVASCFILAAVFTIWTAERAACHTARRTDRHQVRSLSQRRMRTLAVILTLAALGTGGMAALTSPHATPPPLALYWPPPDGASPCPSKSP
jgi:putative membrane protein